MKVFHLLHQYLPEHLGGTELYTQTLARYQIQQQGHQVAIFHPTERDDSYPSRPSWSPNPVRSNMDGTRVYAVPVSARSRTEIFVNTWRHEGLSQAFERVMAIERPDIVHVQHLMGIPIQIIDQIRDAGVPLVISLHDYWFPCANAQLLTNYDGTVCEGPSWWLNCARCALARVDKGAAVWLAPFVAPLFAYRSRRLRQVLEQARLLIAPTYFVRDTYDALGIPAEKIAVIPHGIEIPEYVSLAGRKQPRSPGALHIVYVGGLSWQKGVHVLAEAVNQLPHEGIHLSIFGDLDKFPDYVKRLQETARHPGIRFAGRIDRDGLWQVLLQEADVVVVPSLWYETASLIVQEAFAAGVPVIASRLGALIERVADGVDGLLFPAGDAAALRDVFLRLYEEAGLLERLRTGIRPARRIEEHVADIDRLYHSII